MYTEIIKKPTFFLTGQKYVLLFTSMRYVALWRTSGNPFLEDQKAMFTKTTNRLLGLAVMGGLMAVGSSFAHAAILSNNTGGGDWATGSTWAGGVAPSNADFTVQAPDTVTANGVTLNGTNSNPTILGTLNVGTGSNFTSINRINYNTATAGGILNINGGSVSASQIRLAAGGTLTTNVSNGGSFTLGSAQQNSAGSTINIQAGGTYISTAGGGGTTNLVGGTFINTAAIAPFPTTWNGGELIVNPGTNYGASNASSLANGLSSNATNILNLSNKTTMQAFSLSSTSFSATQGIVRFNVYSATNNDCDLMTWVNTFGDYNLTSNVHLQLEDIGPLPGVAGDYVGKSYKLFNDSSDYTDILATLDAVVWNVGGTDYNVAFTNTLSTDGTLTVSGLTAIPEPATLGLMALGGLMMLPRRGR
ncbi:MAG: PEP-CTERM sorting domain-containing protein [Phycisphaerales bacterium]